MVADLIPSPLPGPPANSPPGPLAGPAPAAGAGRGQPWDARQVGRRLLSLGNRRRIVDHVADHPGIHLRQIVRDLGLALGTVEHHLHLLVRHGLLERHRLQGQTGYFLAGATSPDERLLSSVLRHDGPRRILRALAADADLDAAALARRLGLSKATTAHHVKRLLAAGLLERLRLGRHHLLRLADPEAIDAALRALDRAAPVQPWPGSILDAALCEPAVRHRSDDRPPRVRQLPACGDPAEPRTEAMRSSSP